MEDIQVGDPLKDLYNEFNPKLKLANSFDEFKSVMSNPNNRKDFYNEFNSQLKLANSFDEFDSVLGLKKKDLGGAISSPTELPLQGFNQKQIDLLKKGVEQPVTNVSQKKSSGLVVPTNLPKQEAIAYENDLKINNAAVNTLTDIYKKKGLKFDSLTPAGQKQIKEYIDKTKNDDLSKVTGKDGKEYLVRSQGFFESAKNSLVRSIKQPIESTEINFTDNPEKLADLLDQKIKEEPNVPKEAPSQFTGYLGELVGGVPKLAALTAIPYIGQSAMVGEVYYNALANQRRALYERGLQEGMDRISAAKKAMEVAPSAAIPDALVAAVMAKGVGGVSSSIIPNSAKQSFIKAAGSSLKSVAGVSAVGGFSEYERSKIQQRAGYNVKDAEAIENGLKGAGDYALMDAAFKLINKAPKAVSSAAKNFLSNVHPEILKVVADNYPDGKKTLEEIPKFTETKAKVQEFVPEEKVASVTGLTEKTDNLKKDILDLEEKKKNAPLSIVEEIDKKIKDKNKEVQFYDNQIKKVIESKDETGISEEIDDVTGLKFGEQITPKEVKIGDEVQWTSQGTDQFAEPKKIKSISEDGKYAFVEGSDTGIPVVELSVTKIKPTEVKPEEKKVTVELLSSKEPPQKEGETIVTLSGKTEPERLASIEQRQKDTKVSDKVVADNEIVQAAESYFKKSGNYKNSSEGRAELNNLRIKARENGLTIDTERNAVTKPNKTGRPRKVVYNNKADGDAVIEPDAKTLRDRDINTQKVYEELTDSGVFLDVESESGKRMSASQVEAAIKDINEGIPSKRANKYLDALEKGLAEDAIPLYDKGMGGFAPKLADIRARLGVEKEFIGEPMDEVALNKFLDEESRITPEEEQTLLDNVENLLYEYETTEEGPQGEVQPIEARAEEGVPAKTEPIAEVKKTRKTTKPVEEAPKEESMEQDYKDLTRNEKRRIINSKFEELLTNEDFYKKFKIKSKCL